MTNTASAPAQPAQTFLGNLFQTIKTDASKMFSAFTNVVQHQVWPFVEKLFSTIELDAVQKLAPLADEAVQEVEGDLPVLFSQGVEGFLKVFNATVAGLLQKAGPLLVQVTTTDIITAAHAATLNAETAINNVAAAAAQKQAPAAG